MSPIDRRTTAAAAILALAAGAITPAWAHPFEGVSPAGLAAIWIVEPWTLMSVGVVAWLYARGVRRLWDTAGPGRGISRERFAAFCAGLGTLALALLSPLHGLGGALFSAHMAQHEILILFAAPLIVLGRPIMAFAWAVPRRMTLTLGSLTRRAPMRGLLGMISNPVGAATVHAVALWVWHVPVLYEATSSSTVLHGAQHVSFFGSALLLWWAILGRPQRGGMPGLAALILFVTMVHSNALGALLTFASRPWYPAYESTAVAWGTTALEDQQLGGLIMWVPGGAIYLVVTLLLLHRWIAPRPGSLGTAR